LAAIAERCIHPDDGEVACGREQSRMFVIVVLDGYRIRKRVRGFVIVLEDGASWDACGEDVTSMVVEETD